MSATLGGATQRVKERLVGAIPSSVVDLGLRTLHRLPVRRGTPVYERNWDVLVVLDACRYDMYREVVGSCDALDSVASTSTVWMDTTFGPAYDAEVAGTAYVSANPYSHRLDPARFGLLDHVWADHWDDDLGTIPAEPVTDHGIAVARSGRYDRVILHYMQPHFPFIGDGHRLGRLGRGGFGLGEDDSRNVWRMIERDELDREAVVEAYYANLAYVFESVETLLSNVDGTVAITADHGNALGEFGMWGHRAHVPIEPLRRVPWDVRVCSDGRTYEPTADVDAPAGRDDTGNDVEERLAALGYAEE